MKRWLRPRFTSPKLILFLVVALVLVLLVQPKKVAGQTPTPTPTPSLTCYQFETEAFTSFWSIETDFSPFPTGDADGWPVGENDWVGWQVHVVEWPTNSPDHDLIISTPGLDTSLVIPQPSDLYYEITIEQNPNFDQFIRAGFHRQVGGVGNGVFELCTPEPPPDGTDICPLVENAHFAAEEGWLLDGGATITNSILSLPVGGQAAQNLTLTSNTVYNAVISTTQTISETSLSVVLGTQSESIEITAAGLYTVPFTTTILASPIAYGLENEGDNSLDLDFTCIYTASSEDGQGECIAPINGTFDTADNWTYERGAQWDTTSKKAILPYADVALIYSTSVYTFPIITGTEHLLLSFTSRKTTAETAAIMGRIYDGIDSINWLFETHTTEYTFETSLDTMAGNDNAEIAFVNPGLTGSAEISSTADVTLDNVCIFVANRGPNLPAPQDPDGIDPVDLGFNYTSCDDVDGILAYFGVNMAQYRAEYEAGPSVWDPIGWVPWLVAAFWTILATYLCLFMAAFVALINVLEYLINNFLNIGSWLIRSWLILVRFLYSIWLWFLATLPNILDWLGQAILMVLTWFFLSGGNLIVFTVFILAYLVQAALDFLNWLGLDLPDNLIDLLLNGLKGIANIFIAALNIVLPNLGLVLSEIVDLFVYLWNLLVPFLSDVWGYVTIITALTILFPVFTSLVLAAINLLWMVFNWVWANVFMVFNLPLNFYYAFDNGVKSEAFAYLLTCADQNFWCALLAGVQLVNQVSSHSLVYPIVIVGIIIGSIVVFWKELWALFSTEIS